MIPIRSFAGVSLAQATPPEDLGPGLNTNEEVVAAGGTTATLITNPTAGSKAAASSAISGAGFALVRKATVIDDISPAQPDWFLVLVAT